MQITWRRKKVFLILYSISFFIVDRNVAPWRRRYEEVGKKRKLGNFISFST